MCTCGHLDFIGICCIISLCLIDTFFLLLYNFRQARKCSIFLHLGSHHSLIGIEPSCGVRTVSMKHISAISTRHRPPSPSLTASCMCAFRYVKGKEVWPRVVTCWGGSNPQVGIPPTPWGVSQIQVPLDTDASVADHSTGTRTRSHSPTTEPSWVQMTELSWPSD